MDRVIPKQKNRLKKWTMIGAPLLAVGVFVWFMLSSFGTSRLNVKSDRNTISTVSQGEFQEFIPIQGTVQPITTVYMDAMEGGRVEEIFIENGRMVQKGEPILRLSNQQLQMDCINREVQLLEQQNNLRNALISMDQKTNNLKQELLQTNKELTQAKRTYEINQKLVRDSLIAWNEFEKSKEEYFYLVKNQQLILQNLRADSVFRINQQGQITESLELIRKSLDFLRMSLENLVIKAPISGQLSSMYSQLGETKSKGENLAQIDVTSDYKVRAKIGEHYISRVYTGLKGNFVFNSHEYEVTISKIYPEVTNGEFEIDLIFAAERPEGVKRGQNLQIRLALSDQTHAVKLNRGGFYQSTGGNWVYVLDESGSMAYKKTIRLGRQNPDYYEVLEGLEPGEKVITSGYDVFGDVDELIIE